MSILDLDLELARHYSDTISAKSDFAQKIEQACDLLARMENLQLTFDELLAKSLKAVDDSRAVLLAFDNCPSDI